MIHTTEIECKSQESNYFVESYYLMWDSKRSTLMQC